MRAVDAASLCSGEITAVSQAENAKRREGAAQRAVAPPDGGATFILLYCLDQVVTYFQSGITRRTLQKEPTGSLVPEIWKL